MKNPKKISALISLLRSILVALVIISTCFSPSGAPAQAKNISASGFNSGKDPQVGYNPETGNLAFIGGGAPISVPGVTGVKSLSLEKQALGIVNSYAPRFGLANPATDMSQLSSKTDLNGSQVVHYQQTYQGVPVLAGELVVNMSPNGALLSMSGEVSQNPNLDTTPAISPENAQQVALAATAKWYQLETSTLSANQPSLAIFDETLLKTSTRAPELVWFLRVTSSSPPVREVIMLNAQTGTVSLHYSEVDHIGPAQKSASTARPSIPASPRKTLGSPMIETYSAEGGSSLPGSLVCPTSGCPDGTSGDALLAQQYALDTYNYYRTQHNRDSIDNVGMWIISTVEYNDPSVCPNAYWDGTQMVYCAGFVVDDVVAHEITHGVTDYTSGLFYYYQSGAINESFSDIWGELVDQSNTGDSAGDGILWQIGEDMAGGAFRSMSNPPDFNDPDKISSPNYYTLSSDNGGVHYNSGVSNKAAYLIAAGDGSAFNGYSVIGIGNNKTAAIFYEVQSHLLGAGANFTDLYYAINQACINLTGGTAGITSANCTQVQNATLAVEMNVKPASQPANPKPDLCPVPSDLPASYLFNDNLESGSANWSFGYNLQVSTPTNWSVTTPGLSPSGHSLAAFSDDFASDKYAAMNANISLPAATTTYLYFNHWFDFEDAQIGYDTGVLEYSTNSGSSWNDAQALFNAGQDYTLDTFIGSDNPLAGRRAFSGYSNGVAASRYDLSSLAGQNVRFRWRTGSDNFTVNTGWYVDDIRIYACPDNTTVNIGGNLISSYHILTNSNARPSYVGVNSGPVRVSSTIGQSIIASERVAYTPDGGTTWTDYSELMGIPVSQLGTTYWFPIYDNVTRRTAISFGNVGIASTTVTITLGGTVMGTYNLAPSQSMRFSYPNANGGPMKLQSSGSVPIVASQRFTYSPDNGLTWTGFSETNGLPASQLNTSYMFSWYNNVNLNTQLRFANAGAARTTVTVTIGGVVRGTYILDPNQSTRVSYAGLNTGPVKVSSSGGINIIAAERVTYTPDNGVTWSSYSELMGLPASLVGTSYWFPVYDNVSRRTAISFGNVGVANTTVTIKLGGVLQGTYALVPNQSIRFNYPDLDGGPMQVESSGGVPIIVSQRFTYSPNNGLTWNSFFEMNGLPASQLSTSYLFSWYNNNNLNTQLRFAVP